MHVASGLFTAGVTIFLLCVSPAANRPTMGIAALNAPKKCCAAGYAFSETLECVHVEPDRLNYTMQNAWQTEPQQQIVTVIASLQGLNCRDDVEDVLNRHFLHTYASLLFSPNDHCVERMINGTTVLAKCPSEGDPAATFVVTRTTTITTTVMIITTTPTIATNASSNASVSNREKIHRCWQGLRTVIFWGAQTYMDTNLAHMVLCLIVVVIYLSVPELGRSIYNRAVLRQNVCLMAQGCVLAFLGYSDLCNPVNDEFAVFLWIMLQYFTHATGFWLNVICFDMTLSITRFRWTVGSGQRTNRDKNRRLLLYSAFAWGGALLLAIVALVLEYCPGIPEDFPLKPNYRRFRDGPNVVVNLYFFGVLLLTLFWNNLLFAFTTYKIIRTQRSTEIATRNHNNVLRKKYFLFLQLYLLMGAPWFFGSLLACLNKLVILKICRLTQPIVCLLMLATHKKLRKRLTSKLQCIKRREANAAVS